MEKLVIRTRAAGVHTLMNNSRDNQNAISGLILLASILMITFAPKVFIKLILFISALALAVITTLGGRW